MKMTAKTIPDVKFVAQDLYHLRSRELSQAIHVVRNTISRPNRRRRNDVQACTQQLPQRVRMETIPCNPYFRVIGKAIRQLAEDNHGLQLIVDQNSSQFPPVQALAIDQTPEA